MRTNLNGLLVTRTALFCLCAIALAARSLGADPAFRPDDGPTAFPVTIRVDAAKPLGELKPIWRMFGADEPNYAYMRHGRKLLGELGALRRDDVYFRAHNLLCTGDGTPALKWGSTGVYREAPDGTPRYDWTILDRIFDTYREQGVRPYAEIGFMPEALSIQPQPYQHHWTPTARYQEIITGWAYPPKDYNKWRDLVFEWVKHCVQRYGKTEVGKWYWEVWNEANGFYWKATPAEFHKLHDYAIDGVRRALPGARVGGPDAAGAGGPWTRSFLDHCLHGTNYATGAIGTPLDFVAFHAKGSPAFVDGHVRMGIAHHLRTIDDGFQLIGSYPELRNVPVVIGESDPEGCAACQGPQLGYRNGTMYSSYTAASFARKWQLARRHGVNLDAALTWAFTFEDQSLFAGFRQLASGGVDLPVLNVFRMFSTLHGQQLTVRSDGEIDLDEILREGVRGRPDVSAVAALADGQLSLLLWHYHDDDVAGPPASVHLTVNGLTVASRQATLTRYAIDAEHSNSFSAWRRMGSPTQPDRDQLAQLEKAGRLAQLGSPEKIRVSAGTVQLETNLARQAVVLITLTWAQEP